MINRTFLKYIGFRYSLNNRSLILQFISMTKETQQLTNEKLASLIKNTSKLLDQTSNQENLQELFGDLSFVTEELNDFNEPFYKFIHKETYDNFISKGKHRLGSLKYYREIEKNESRDEKEGFSNLIINSGNRQIFTSVISGFDKYILCGTSNLDEQKYMSQNFGGYVLKIRNIKSFAEKIKKAIGAIDWQVRKVRYSDYKAYLTDINIKDLNGVSPDLSNEMFDILYKISETPSVFCKPERFSAEQELRLAFSMGRDVKKFLEFDNKGLLDDIEVLKI